MNFDPNASDPRSSPELVEATAAAWLSLRDRGMSSYETVEFMRWLQEHPQHAVVFAELDRTWKEFDRLASVVAANSRVPHGDPLVPRVRLRRRRRVAWAMMGAVAAGVMVLLAVIQLGGSRHTAETAVGAFQKLDLPDGSVAQLNTDTAIDMTFTATERRVRVVRGEVFFTVKKDPNRPFIVMAGPVAVRAVGTAFNVRHREAAIEVLVTEGRVLVDDVDKGQSLLAPTGSKEERSLLVAGERAIVDLSERATAATPTAATVVKVAVPEVQRALAWQERRLEFDAVPLVEVVREFNRYNRSQLSIADPVLATKLFSGTFRADGFESFVRLLEADFGVSAIRSEREIVLGISH